MADYEIIFCNYCNQMIHKSPITWDDENYCDCICFCNKYAEHTDEEVEKLEETIEDLKGKVEGLTDKIQEYEDKIEEKEPVITELKEIFRSRLYFLRHKKNNTGIVMSYKELFLKRREELGLTQAKVAESINIPRTIVSMIETGVRIPTRKQFKDIQDLFNISDNELREIMETEITDQIKLMSPYDLLKFLRTIE